MRAPRPARLAWGAAPQPRNSPPAPRLTTSLPVPHPLTDLPGWKDSTVGVKKFRSLPRAAQGYIRRIEELVGVDIAWVGTGPARTDIIARGVTFDMPAE